MSVVLCGPCKIHVALQIEDVMINGIPMERHSGVCPRCHLPYEALFSKRALTPHEMESVNGYIDKKYPELNFDRRYEIEVEK